MIQNLPPVILASKSPRRQQLLAAMGITYESLLKEVDEQFPPGLKPEEVAVYISEQKAAAFAEHSGTHLVITSDTIVALDGEILGKPADAAHASDMLNRLAGRAHEVYTGVTLFYQQHKVSFFDCSEVFFRSVTQAEIDHYLTVGQPFDKAGAYGVQDWWGLVVVERINGSYTNVMGLPTERLYLELKEFAGRARQRQEKL
ncbi:septum formation protein Maf [Pedobacter yulinensis]|uniref:dTTP/UTP pyrophosphatase n=1 Tax=Pedobacter yulinensis TaxID=2126353 RepID=A0A2T3HH56_9SPHI|nr:Maf family protein [Pedobacter yulinensis]PST81770.1 septum formation protein Maf [Pedobacter yulinensis]